jgi:hypothetical protein
MVKWNDNDNKYAEGKGYKGWHYKGIVRLFRNMPGIKFVYHIHESVKPSIIKIGKIESSSIPIHHYTKNTKQKDEYYLKLLKKKIKEHPTANSYAELAFHLKQMGKDKDAMKYANKAIALDSKLSHLLNHLQKN